MSLGYRKWAAVGFPLESLQIGRKDMRQDVYRCFMSSCFQECFELARLNLLSLSEQRQQ